MKKRITRFLLYPLLLLSLSGCAFSSDFVAGGEIISTCELLYKPTLRNLVPLKRKMTPKQWEAVRAAKAIGNAICLGAYQGKSVSAAAVDLRKALDTLRLIQGGLEK